MKTELVETGKLSSQLTIVLEQADYQDKFNAEIKKYKDKAHLKGFRKGKVPISAIKKMYGKSVLAEVVNDKLQQALSDYIVDNKLDILGNPLPSENQEQIDFDMKNLGDFEFIFDLGLAPDFDVVGAGEEDEYDDVKVSIEDSLIDEELTNIQKRYGTQEEVDSEIEENDIVSIEITELNAPEGREAFSTTITAMPDRLTDDYQKQVLGKKLGDEFELNIFEFEKDAQEDYVKKYFLKDAPEDITADYRAIIATIKRLQPAELGEELYEKAFGEDKAKTEDEARELLREELEKFYNQQGESITKRYILDKLIESNELEFPDEFLKKWLQATNESVSAEDIEKDYPGFAKNLTWTLIKQKIAKAHDLEIGAAELRASLRNKIQAQFAQYGSMPGINYDDMVDRLMQNQETVQKEYEELLAETVLSKVKDVVKLNEKTVSIDEYKSIVKGLQENID